MKKLIRLSAIAFTFALPLGAATSASAQVGLPNVGVGVGAGGGPAGVSRSSPASRYTLPPTGPAMRSSLAGKDLDNASPSELADIVDAIATDLSDCSSIGRRISMEISTSGAQAVHPDWIGRYQDCLQQREKDLLDVRETVSAQQPEGEGEDTALLDNVKADLDELDEELRDAFNEQERLVSDYNFGR